MEDELDLNILKAITSDKISALTFSNNFYYDLFAPENQAFGKTCLDYIKTYKSIPTERTLLESAKEESKKQLIQSKWQDLELHEYNVNEFPFDLERLKKRYKYNKVEEIRRQAALEDQVEDLEGFYKDLALKLNEVAAIDVGRSFIHKSAGDYVEEFRETYKAVKDNPEVVQCIKTGFSAYDLVTGGLGPSELLVVGGETGAGKSMVLNNIAKNVWLQDNDIESDFINKGNNVLYFSLEMPHKDCFNRFLACLADVPQLSIRDAVLDDLQERKVEQALKFIEKYQSEGFYFDIVDVPRGLTISEMELRFNDALLRYSPDVVIVDYLGLMESEHTSKDPDWLKLGLITASLHEFARAYNIPVVTAAQLTDLKRSSRSSTEEEGKRIGPHRFGRSSLILHNVNTAIQIETRPSERDLYDLAYHVVKNRKGPLISGNLVKNFANASLIDIPTEEGFNKSISADDIPNLIKKFQEEHGKE